MASSSNSSQVACRLIPVHSSTTEVLTHRPELAVRLGESKFLGDNDDTEIVDPTLSHQVVKVYETRGKLFAYCLSSGRGNVRLNNQAVGKGERRKLQNEDILLLRGDNGGGEYSYRVQRADATVAPALQAPAGRIVLREISVDSSPSEASNSSDSEETAAAPKKAAVAAPNMLSQVGEHLICPICMEIMVEASTVVPCGHSFCRQCLATQSECAECRGPVHGRVPCRALQNVIDGLVDVSNSNQEIQIFEKEDVTGYLSRRKKTANATALGGARKRRRGGTAARLREFFAENRAQNNQNSVSPEVISLH